MEKFVKYSAAFNKHRSPFENRKQGFFDLHLPRGKHLVNSRSRSILEKSLLSLSHICWGAFSTVYTATLSQTLNARNYSSLSIKWCIFSWGRACEASTRFFFRSASFCHDRSRRKSAGVEFTRSKHCFRWCSTSNSHEHVESLIIRCFQEFTPFILLSTTRFCFGEFFGRNSQDKRLGTPRS